MGEQSAAILRRDDGRCVPRSSRTSLRTNCHSDPAAAATAADLCLQKMNSTTEDPPCRFAVVCIVSITDPTRIPLLSFLCNIAGIPRLPTRLKLMDVSRTGCPALDKVLWKHQRLVGKRGAHVQGLAALCLSRVSLSEDTRRL